MCLSATVVLLKDNSTNDQTFLCRENPPRRFVLCVFTKYHRNGNRNCVWNMTRLLLLYQLSK